MVEGMDAERQSEERCAAAACPGLSACLACPVDALEPSPPDEWSGPIWPTKARGLSGEKRYAALMQAGSYTAAAAVARRLCAVRLRTRGIAEGHVRARARMRRFVAWLDRIDANDEARDIADGALSPEHALFLMVEDICAGTVMDALGPVLVQAYIVNGLSDADVRAFARRVLASPEWAALPWQREAGR